MAGVLLRRAGLRLMGEDRRRAFDLRLAWARGFIASIESFDHPAWLYRSRHAIPAANMCFREPRPVSEADLALCARLLLAYERAQADAPRLGGMWSHAVFQERQRDLVEALDRGDVQPLAELLSSMFRADFVLGIAPGSLGLVRVPRLARRFTELAVTSKLVALAESRGAARVENPEQGAVGIALHDGLATLMDATEHALGISLDFPDVGAAYGLDAAGRLVTPDTPDQVYGAARLCDALAVHIAQRDGPYSVVEIGAGYGGMAYWFLRMSDAALRYTIVDLPVVNVLQGYFLASALGSDQVSFYGETPERIAVLPGHALDSIAPRCDALVNKDSFPEIPPDAAREYLEWARSACAGIFYSYNQESATEFAGSAQTVVAELIAETGGFTRLRRDPSWLRRGYVEEIYVATAATRARHTSAQLSSPSRGEIGRLSTVAASSSVMGSASG